MSDQISFIYTHDISLNGIFVYFHDETFPLVHNEASSELQCASPQLRPFQEPTTVIGNEQLSNWISKEYLDVSCLPSYPLNIYISHYLLTVLKLA